MRFRSEISIVTILAIAFVLLFTHSRIPRFEYSVPQAYKGPVVTIPEISRLASFLDDGLSNASIDIATLKRNYLLGEEVNITDPPVELEKAVPLAEGLSQPILLENAPVVFGIADKGAEGIFALNPPESKGYLVEFRKEPLLVRKVGLEKRVKEAQLRFEKQNGISGNSVRELETELARDNAAVRLQLAEYADQISTDQAAFRRKIMRLKAVPEREYTMTFNGMHIMADDEAIKKISQLPEVKGVYPNRKVHAFLDNSIPQMGVNLVWQMEDSLGRNIRGTNITIAIIDTGVDYTHPSLGGCNRTNNISDGSCSKVIGGYDFVNLDNDPMDDQMHGTHCAGIAAGNGLLNGVAPDAKIIAFKVLSSEGAGYNSDVIAAIERSADLNNNGIPAESDADIVQVMSLSLGSSAGDPDDPESTAVDNAVDAGVVAVIAAGNAGPDNSTIGSPGTARKAITVGAVDQNDVIADFSSRGPVIWDTYQLMKPDIVAPGVSICAAQYDSAQEGVLECNPQVDRHIALSGTSMATPHVAGAAALIRQAYPDWTPEMVKAAIKDTANDLGYEENVQGSGRINLTNILNYTFMTLVLPYSLNYGQLDARESINRTLEISIMSLSGIQHFNITVLQDSPGISFDYPDEITVEHGETEYINITLEMDESTVGTGAFTGLVVVSSENQTYALSLYFSVSFWLNISTNISSAVTGYMIMNHSTKEVKQGGFFSRERLISLPLDIYDFIFFYADRITAETREDGFILREGVNLAGVSSLSFGREDAKYYFNSSMLNRRGEPIQENITELALFSTMSGGYIMFTILLADINRPYEQKMNLKVSNLSEFYTLHYFSAAYNNKDFYVSKIHQTNITGNISHVFEADNFSRKTLHFNINETPNHNLSSLTLNAQVNSNMSESSSFNNILFAPEGTNIQVAEPYYQELYMTPRPSQAYRFQGILFNVLENESYTPGPPMAKYYNPLFDTSPIREFNEHETELSTRISTATADEYVDYAFFNTTEQVLEFGAYPYWLRPELDVIDDSFKLITFASRQSIYDRDSFCVLVASLYVNNTLLCNRIIPNFIKVVYNLSRDSWPEDWLYSCPAIANVTFPARIRLIMHKPAYFITSYGTEEHELRLEFDTGLQDKKPPLIDELRLFSNNRPTYYFGLENNNTLQMIFDEQDLSTVSVWLVKPDGEWLGLNTTGSQNNYTTEIPAFSYIEYTLVIYAEDSSNNSMRYEFQVPSSIVRLPKSRIVNPDPYNMTATLNMRVEKYDSVWSSYEQNYLDELNITMNSIYGLDLLWNQNPFVPNETGIYRAVAELESGTLLNGADGPLRAEYLFYVNTQEPYTDYLAGDVDLDGDVDIRDLALVSWDLPRMISQYNTDLNDDAAVDILDLVIVGINFGSTLS